MAKIETKKNFKIIKMTGKEAREIWGRYGGTGICDRCNNFQKDEQNCYYVAILNYFMCQKCFSDWVKLAKWHKDDEYFETMNFNQTIHLLKSLNILENE